MIGTSRKAVPGEVRDGIRMIACDVTDDASVAEAVALAHAELGRIDLLVNNAGYAVSGAAEESSVEQVRALFDTNFLGVVRVTNAVLPIMRAQGHGRILNIGSVLGLIPGPFGAYYSASKHAIEGYSESLDHEVRPFGIRVAVIEPWATKTAIEANSPQGDRPVAAYAQTLARYRAAFDAAMAAGDTAEDVAAPFWRRRRTGPRGCAILRARPPGRPRLPGVSCRARCSTGPCASNSTSPERPP